MGQMVVVARIRNETPTLTSDSSDALVVHRGPMRVVRRIYDELRVLMMSRLEFRALLVSVLLGCGAIVGCGESSSGTPVQISGNPPPLFDDPHGEGCAHASRGPHDGELLELGRGNYHVELVHDDDTHTVSVYVLDATATSMVPIAADEIQLNLILSGEPKQFRLPSVAQSTDPAGSSSCFCLQDELLCTALDAKNTKGRIVLAVDERPYSADLRRADRHTHR